MVLGLRRQTFLKLALNVQPTWAKTWFFKRVGFLSALFGTKYAAQWPTSMCSLELCQWKEWLPELLGKTVVSRTETICLGRWVHGAFKEPPNGPMCPLKISAEPSPAFTCFQHKQLRNQMIVSIFVQRCTMKAKWRQQRHRSFLKNWRTEWIWYPVRQAGWLKWVYGCQCVLKTTPWLIATIQQTKYPNHTCGTQVSRLTASTCPVWQRTLV